MITDFITMLIVMAMFGSIALMFAYYSDKFYNRLNLYRQKYGFDRTLEAKDIKGDSEKVNKILGKRIKNFEKEINKK